jgi:hypothetical protein
MESAHIEREIASESERKAVGIIANLRERGRHLDQQGAPANTAGEWCCNAFDCAGDRRGETKVTPRGYVLENGEMIPHSNAAISGDGQYWQCRRSDKSSRCFFFPPSAT